MGQEDTSFDSRALSRFNLTQPRRARRQTRQLHWVESPAGLARSHAQGQVQGLRCAALPQLTQDDPTGAARALERVLWGARYTLGMLLDVLMQVVRRALLQPSRPFLPNYISPAVGTASTAANSCT